MDIRQEFEAWSGESGEALERYPQEGQHRGEYYDLGIELEWKAYQAGRRAGAEDMRERAAQENDCGCECRQEVLNVLKTSGRRKAKYACTQTAGECLALNAADIRTLPVEE